MTTIQLRLDGASRIMGRESLFLSFSYDSKVVSSIKSLSKRWYHPDTREWEVQVEDYKNVKKVLSFATFTFTNTSEKEILDKLKAYAQPQVAPKPVDLASFTFKTTPYKYQMEGIEFGLNHPAFLLGDEQGLGKAQPLYSKILTPNGWITMGETKIGMKVIGSNGKTYEITGVFPQGKKKVYEIVFNDGSKVRCTDEHLWNVKLTRTRNRTNPFITLELNDIIEEINNGQRAWVPMIQPVDFESRKVDIDPYVLGALLGDGSLTGNSIKFSTGDEEMIDFLSKRIPENHEFRFINNYDYGVVFSGNRYNGNHFIEVLDYETENVLKTFETMMEAGSWLIENNITTSRSCNSMLSVPKLRKKGNVAYGFKWNVQEKEYFGGNKIINALKRYKLKGCNSSTKFIPEDYLYNSYEVRLETLQGLMDTDGYISKKGTIQFYSISKDLALGVKELVQSLGGIARFNEKKNSSYLKNGVRKFGKTVYILTINLPDGINPFKLTRKKEKVIENKKYKPIRIINEINFIDYEESRCISVNAPDQLYVTDEYALTHNTKQALDLALLRKEEIKHCLIICGINGLKYNWLEEIETHTNEKAKIIGSRINTKGRLVEGTVKERLEDLKKLPEEFFLITNIETLRQDSIRDELAKWINFKQIGMVIIDEAHTIKNGTSKQGKAVRYLRAPYKVAMTGTPLINKPLDLYNIMTWLGAITYEQEPFPVFRAKYCIMDDWGSVIGYKNKGELAQRLDEIMIRRKKNEVLDLPPKVSVTNYVEISGAQDKLYRQTQQGILKRINRTGLLEQEELTELRNTLEQINYLRKIATFPSSNDPSITSNPKMDRLKEILEEKIESGEKVIVYSHWKDVVEALTKELSEYNPCVITGDVSTSKRQEEVRKFQNDPSHKVMIGTIDALGTGFTLTAAQTVVFMDNPWTAAKKAQAEDRAHRIGTKGSVTIITLIAKNTIDEKIAHLLKEKEQLAKDIVDSEADEGLIMKMDKEKLKWLFS